MEDVMIGDDLLKEQYPHLVYHQFQNLVQQTLAEQEEILLEKSQDFFQDNNSVSKKKKLKPYTTTRLKSRNFLSNISYSSVSNADIIDRNFCFDVYVLLTKGINPFSLERKLNNQAKY